MNRSFFPQSLAAGLVLAFIGVAAHAQDYPCQAGAPQSNQVFELVPDGA
jgi:hypothetical protein